MGEAMAYPQTGRAYAGPIKHRSRMMVMFGKRLCGTALILAIIMPAAPAQNMPPIKIVVVSGHVQLDQNELPSDSRFFGKPFEAQKMIGELRALIAD